MTNYMPPATPQGVPTSGSFRPFHQTPQREDQATSQSGDATLLYPPSGGPFAQVKPQPQPVPPTSQVMNTRMSYQQAPFSQAPQAMNANMAYQQPPFSQAP